MCIRDSLYVGVEAVLLYVESSFVDNSPLWFQFPIMNKARTKYYGYFGIILPKNNHKGGFYLSARIPSDIARILDRHFIR
ncbi:MAG: hypothetical protein N2578_08715, partial [Bdellovibrionaceae bacterium]|nr:hypothetical protein [Pseudobdellovibrionaceae bacterium]